MNKADVREILEYISLNYKNFEITEKLFDMWLDELQQYDKQDVMEKLKQMMSTGYHNNQPPVLVSIISGLTKKSKKIDWTKQVTYCRRCNKAFQCDEKGYSKDYKEHEGKCRSIDYVTRQSKKWFNKDISRAELWAMSNKEFDERYNKLLNYIKENTDNELEKQLIENVFNPPNRTSDINLVGENLYD